MVTDSFRISNSAERRGFFLKENSIVLKMILKLMIIILSTDQPEIIFLTAVQHKIKGSLSGLRQFLATESKSL